MSDTAQRKTESTTNSFPYVLRILLASIVIASVNALIIAFQSEQYIATANLLLCSSMILVFYALGNILDKKLVLWSFRLYRWTINQGLFESLDSDGEAEHIPSQDSRARQ